MTFTSHVVDLFAALRQHGIGTIGDIGTWQ